MFWDSSALVPLVVAEPGTAHMMELARGEKAPAIWWATPVECQTAVARRHRESPFPPARLAAMTVRISKFGEDATTIAPIAEVRDRARRLVGLHPLRAADALQLAAALVWCEEQPAGQSFVCLDERLREAATREGFTVVPAAGGGVSATILQDESEPYR